MPSVVDRNARREEIAAAAARTIARSGLEGATARAVAKEGGWSTGTISHYFTNQDDVLRAATSHVAAKSLARYKRAEKAATGCEAIEMLGQSVLPNTPTRRAEFRVWLALSTRASVDPVIRREALRSYAAWYSLVADLFRRGQTDGSVDPTLDPEAAAVTFQALLDGLSFPMSLGAIPPQGLPEPYLDSIRTRPAT